MSKQTHAKHRRYEWAYTQPPECDNQGFVTRRYELEPPGFGLIEPTPLTGKLLITDALVFPEGLTSDDLDVMASKHIRKTMVCVMLRDPITAGEKGWLRIVAKPERLDAADPKTRRFPGAQRPFQHEYGLVIGCPHIVRVMLNRRLDTPTAEVGPAIPTQCERIRRVALNEGAYADKTSTRISDHRISLIVDGDIEVGGMTYTEGVKFIGRIPSLEERGYTALLWGGGSDCNREHDLLHNAKRVVDMIRYNGAKRMEDIALLLSPSAKHEAFSLLLKHMFDARLLISKDGLLHLPDDLVANQELSDGRMTALRHMYVARSSGDAYRLLAEFTDLHPFKIDFQLRWFARGGDSSLVSQS